MSAVSACRMRGVGPRHADRGQRQARCGRGSASRRTPRRARAPRCRCCSRGGGCARSRPPAPPASSASSGSKAASGASPSSAAMSVGSRHASSALPAPDVCAGIARPISVNSRTLRVPGHAVDVDDVLPSSTTRFVVSPVSRWIASRCGRAAVRSRCKPVLQPAGQLEQLVAEQIAPAGRRSARRTHARPASPAAGAPCSAPTRSARRSPTRRAHRRAPAPRADRAPDRATAHAAEPFRRHPTAPQNRSSAMRT